MRWRLRRTTQAPPLVVFPVLICCRSVRKHGVTNGIVLARCLPTFGLRVDTCLAVCLSVCHPLITTIGNPVNTGATSHLNVDCTASLVCFLTEARQPRLSEEWTTLLCVSCSVGSNGSTVSPYAGSFLWVLHCYYPEYKRIQQPLGLWGHPLGTLNLGYLGYRVLVALQPPIKPDVLTTILETYNSEDGCKTQLTPWRERKRINVKNIYCI